MKNQISLYLTLTLFILNVNSLQRGDDIHVYVNKVSPYANSLESYSYYSLPFCQPDDIIEGDISLGEKLSGNHNVNSLYQIKYPINVKNEPICERELNSEDIVMFINAIKKDWYYEMYLENFAIGGPIGMIKLPGERYEKILLGNHLMFTIWYNTKNQKIVTATVSFDEDDTLDLYEDDGPMNVTFYYSVEFRETTFESDEVNKGIDTFFAESPSLWPIFNIVVLCNILGVGVWLILNKLTKDNTQIGIHDQEIGEKGKIDIFLPYSIVHLACDDNNWKKLRNDVLKSPNNIMFLSAAAGTGFHLFTLALIFMLFGTFGFYYSSKGAAIVTGIILYLLTSAISGVISARLFKYLGGTLKWASNVLLSAFIIPIPLLVTIILLNNFAWIADSANALPLTTIAFVFIIWLFVAVPLTICGGITGRTKESMELLSDLCVKEKKSYRQIPKLPLYMKPISLVIASGLIPFLASSHQLYYIFNSLWNHKIYNLWGELFFTFAIVIAIIGCVTIILLYLQFSSMDYRWWSRSFFYGGSLGIYIFIYAIYYYYHSGMNGFLQTIFYFGYNAMIAFGAFLMFGSISFATGFAFVLNIYESVKIAQFSQFDGNGDSMLW